MLCLYGKPIISDDDLATSPLEEARAREVKLRRQILALPEMLTADEFRQRIKEAYAEHLPETLRVLVLPDEHGELRFPAWQINLSGLGRVLAELEDVDSWMQLRFLTGPDTYLRDRTPVEAMEDANVTAAFNATRGFAEMEQGQLERVASIHNELAERFAA